MPHSHRSGQLKQRNKEHKTGRHRTKGQLDREFKGEFLECMHIAFTRVVI